MGRVKGKSTGVSNAQPGLSGEKYICFEKKINKYAVVIPTRKSGKGKQKTIGRFKKLQDAVSCRDKYLEEFN